MLACFFLQAEDGIRDYKVTGVQTCALPISDTRVDAMHARKMAARLQAATKGKRPILLRLEGKAGHGAGKPLSKIGRASCREREAIEGVSESITEHRRRERRQ